MTLLARYGGAYPTELWGLLELAWERGGLTVQSDWCRAMAVQVGLAASLGWLSTIAPDGRSYGPRWRLTAAGLQALSHKEHFLT